MSADSLTPVTKCEGCVFSKLEGSKQIGCDLGRHEKLGFSTLYDDTTFTLERFCNAYRPEEWSSSLDFEDRLDTQDTVMKEVAPKDAFTSIFLTKETTFDAFAQKHGTTTQTLNELNGWNLPRATVLARGSEIQIPN